VGAKSFEWFKVPVNYNMTSQFRSFCHALGKDAVTSAGILVGVWALAARDLPDGDLGSCDPGWLAEQVGYNSPKASLKTAYGQAIIRSLVACKYATDDLKLIHRPFIDPLKNPYKGSTADHMDQNNKGLPEPPHARAQIREEKTEKREEKREDPVKDVLDPPFSNFPRFTRGEVNRLEKDLDLTATVAHDVLRAVDAEITAGHFTAPYSRDPEKVYQYVKRLAEVTFKKLNAEQRRNAGKPKIRFE